MPCHGPRHLYCVSSLLTSNPDTSIAIVETATSAGSNSKFLYVAKYQKATKLPSPRKKGMPTKGNMRASIRCDTFSGMLAVDSFTC